MFCQFAVDKQKANRYGLKPTKTQHFQNWRCSFKCRSSVLVNSDEWSLQWVFIPLFQLYYYFIFKGRKHTSTSSVSEWTFPDRSSATTRWSDAWQQKQCMCTRLKSLQSILNDYINCKLKVKSSIWNPEKRSAIISFLPGRWHMFTHCCTLQSLGHD